MAIHGGYDTDPTTKAVAVPIYQTVGLRIRQRRSRRRAVQSRSRRLSLQPDQQSDHRGARAARRRARRRRRCAVRGLRPGGAELRGAQCRRAWAATSSRCRSSTAPPTRCSPTCCRARASRSASPNPISAADIEKLIDDDTRAVFCESVGNPAGNVCDIEALAEVGARHGVPLIVDNTVATPILLRPIEYGADIVVHSLTKFMGGHGTTLGGVIVDSGRFPWAAHAAALSDVQRAGRVLSRPGLHRAFRRRAPISRAAAASISAPPARCCRR